MAKNIQIIELRKIDNGNLKAFVDIRLGETIIRDFRVIQQDDQTPWVSAPQTAWTDSNGQTRFKTIIHFPQELKKIIEGMILNAYQRKIGAVRGEPF